MYTHDLDNWSAGFHSIRAKPGLDYDIVIYDLLGTINALVIVLQTSTNEIVWV